MLIQIKPIERTPWHGHKGDVDFTRDTTFTALVDGKSMQYAVDMTEEELKEYAVKIGRDLNRNFIPQTSHPFWDSKMATITLKNITVVLDTSNPLDYIKYKICKASSSVANSIADYESGLYPKSTHYIYSEEEETAVKATKVQVKNAAIKLSMSATRVIKNAVCFLVGGRYTKAMSNDAVDVVIDELIAIKALEVKEAFEEAIADKESVLVKNLVEEALYFNVLTKRSGGIFYFETQVGFDNREVVEFLKQDVNQGIKLQIMKAIKS
jgi:hypothetical protein